MTVFVDTSAWYALVSATDHEHQAASAIYVDLVDRRERLITTSYILAETMGLIQHRVGFGPLELFARAARTVDVVWVDRARHEEAEAMLFERKRRGVNIVDASSFATMRALEIETAFAFDEDFVREGFQVLDAV